MAIEHEDFELLKREFDDRYVLQNDCDKVQASVNKKFANDDKRIDLLCHQQSINNWLTTAIAGGIITLLIKVFIGG